MHTNQTQRAVILVLIHLGLKKINKQTKLTKFKMHIDEQKISCAGGEKRGRSSKEYLT